jgi:hypothetical protein
MAVGFVETNGLGILNPGVSRSQGRARAVIYRLCEGVSEFNRRSAIHLDGAAATEFQEICDLPVPRRPPENHRIR